MLVSDGGEQGAGLCVRKVLLMLGTTVRGSNESLEYALLQYMDPTCLTDTVD